MNSRDWDDNMPETTITVSAHGFRYSVTWQDDETASEVFDRAIHPMLVAMGFLPETIASGAEIYLDRLREAQHATGHDISGLSVGAQEIQHHRV